MTKKYSVWLAILILGACSGSDDSASADAEPAARRSTIGGEWLLSALPDACLLLSKSLAEEILGAPVTAEFSQPILNIAVSKCGWYRSGARPPGISISLFTFVRTQLGMKRLGEKYGDTVAGYFNAQLVREIGDVGRWAGLVKTSQGDYELITSTPVFLDRLSPGIATHGTHLKISYAGLTNPVDAQAVLIPIARRLLDELQALTVAGEVSETVTITGPADEDVVESTTRRCVARESEKLQRTESGNFPPNMPEEQKQQALAQLAEQQCAVVELMCSEDLSSSPCQKLLQLYEN